MKARNIFGNISCWSIESDSWLNLNEPTFNPAENLRHSYHFATMVGQNDTGLAKFRCRTERPARDQTIQFDDFMKHLVLIGIKIESFA